MKILIKIYIIILVLISGCSTIPDADVNSLQTETLRLPASNLIAEYKIGVDDVIKINVWKNPELSIEVPVRPDGKISVPLIGDVRAGGFTPDQVAKLIKGKLKKYLRDPIVAVIMTKLNSHEYLSRVRVTGAVRNPVSLNFRQGMTVLDAVLAAGGLNDFASAGNTKLYRRIKDKVNAVSIELDAILHDGKLQTNYILKPGDIITIPERLF